MIDGINHVTFSVSSLAVSLQFYRNWLGMQLHVSWDTGAYLTAGETWICLSLGTPKPANDYTHVAFTLSEQVLRELRTRLPALGVEQWQQNSSEGDSLYILDPDGHRLELHCGCLATRLVALQQKPYKGLIWH